MRVNLITKSVEEILTDRINKNKTVDLLKKDSEKFDEALRLALSSKKPQAWRSAWLLNHVVEKNDARVYAKAKKIISIINKREDGHQRELLKLIEKVEIGEKHESRLFDICLNIWEDIGKVSSVRITAFRILVRFIKKYPELQQELTHLTQDHYTETLSPGVRHSFQKLKKRFL